MPTPLDYSPPPPVRRGNGVACCIAFGVCGFVSSVCTDEAIHRMSGTHSDGGVSFICMALLVPTAILMFVVRELFHRRVRLSAALGAMFGLLGPPVGLAILIVTRII